MQKKGFGRGLLVVGAVLAGLFVLSRRTNGEGGGDSNGGQPAGAGNVKVSISRGVGKGVGALITRASLTGTVANTGAIIATFRVHLYTRTFFAEVTGWQPTVDTVQERSLSPGESWSVAMLHDESLGYGDAYDAWGYVHITAPVLKDIVTTPHTTKNYTVAGTFTGGPSISGRGSGLRGMGRMSGYR